MKVAGLILFIGFAAFAQEPLPNTVVMAGGGLQPNAGGGAYQASGFTSICFRAPDIPFFSLKIPSYVCQATDYFGTATAPRIDSEGVLFHKSILAGGWKLGGGVATNEMGFGGSFTAGGWLSVRIAKMSEKSAIYVVQSGTWQKDDVLTVLRGTTSTLPAQFKALGERGVYRVGIAISVN